MYYVQDKKKPDHILFIAESDTDMKCLTMLYEAKICFGMYMLYDYKNDTRKISKEAKLFMKTFPLASGGAFISRVSGFVPQSELKKE